jgi:hypothetical protein
MSGNFSKEKAEKQLRLISKILIYYAIAIAIAVPVVIVVDYVSGVRGALAKIFFVFLILSGFTVISGVFIWLFVQYRRAMKARGG